MVDQAFYKEEIQLASSDLIQQGSVLTKAEVEGLVTAYVELVGCEKRYEFIRQLLCKCETFRIAGVQCMIVVRRFVGFFVGVSPARSGRMTERQDGTS